MTAAFTGSNIAAIIAAAQGGGTRKAVLDRAGTVVTVSNLQKWLTQGRRDREAGKETAYGVFYALWVKNFTGIIASSETRRMAEMKKALGLMDDETIDGKRPRTTKGQGGS